MHNLQEFRKDLEKAGIQVCGTTQEFDAELYGGSKGLWLNGEQLEYFDYWAPDPISKIAQEIADKHDYSYEWYDGGTIMAHPA